MMVQQECFLYESGDVVYAYGKSIPCCPDCGQRMYVHGTCKRMVRTAENSDRKQYILRVLVCRPCRKTHRELPDFVVPHKGYSYDYMYAVAMGREEALDKRKKDEILDLLCEMLLLLCYCMGSMESVYMALQTVPPQDIYKKMKKLPVDFFGSKNKNSIDMNFSKNQKRAILSAIQSKGVALDENKRKTNGNRRKYGSCAVPCACR